MTTVTGELDRTTVAALQGCRYRYAPDPGCTATYGAAQKQGLYAHEKSTAAHALHRVTLRDCPECGAGCGDEIKRGMHLKAEHGIRAGSEKRQEVDAVQVKELYDAQYRNPSGPDDMPSPEVPEPWAGRQIAQQGTAATSVSPALTAPPVSLNGHSPAALDLTATLDSFTALAAELVAEVETLRAENARLRASLAVDPDVAADASRYRQIKSAAFTISAVVNAAQD